MFYATDYDEFTGAPSAWNMIYCKNDNGYFCIGHGNPNDPDPTYQTQSFNYEDVTKIEIRKLLLSIRTDRQNSGPRKDTYY